MQARREDDGHSNTPKHKQEMTSATTQELCRGMSRKEELHQNYCSLLEGEHSLSAAANKPCSRWWSNRPCPVTPSPRQPSQGGPDTKAQNQLVMRPEQAFSCVSATNWQPDVCKIPSIVSPCGSVICGCSRPHAAGWTPGTVTCSHDPVSMNGPGSLRYSSMLLMNIY